MAEMMELNEGNFETEVLQSDTPVLVDFWGPGCGPCRMLTPVLEELAAENEGKIKFAKVNTHEAMSIAAQYQVQVLPTLLLFKNADVVKNFTGLQTKGVLQEAIDDVVG